MTPADSFEIVDRNDVLHLIPRHRKPMTDDVLLRVFHRTTGGGRSILLDRQAAQDLHDWLGRWLEQGWDGVKPPHSALRVRGEAAR